LCGAISFEVRAPLNPPDACHCSQCRKQTGHFFVCTDVPRSDLIVSGANHVSWYKSSEKVQRGFCKHCGSTLFWDPFKKDWTAVAMGAFESPTGTHIEKHIHVASKGDYYDIRDGLPQKQN
jgi:hypothetical protein